jgi:hypothetical protein
MTQENPSPDRNRPLRERIYGVTVDIEGEEKVMVPPGPPVPLTGDYHRATIEELAGITVDIEGEEKILGSARPKDPDPPTP